MGEGLFDEVEEYVAAERDVDMLVGYSMRRLCLEDADNCLKETRYTQPSLYIVNALHYYRALAEGAVPDYVAGHSLGEYNALLAAGVFDLLDGLRLVLKRAELMAQAKNGGMAAVIGLSVTQVTDIMKETGLDAIDVGNFNAPSQVVISGPLDEINRAGPTFERAGASAYMPLQVSTAFHSRYMSDAARSFSEFLAPRSFRTPRVPVISSVTARPIASSNPSLAVKSLLVDQITQSVRWMQTVQYLVAQGVTNFREVGVGDVLTRLTEQIRSDG
jgi:malonyl CoA-acyl carrier protein transacylase